MGELNGLPKIPPTWSWSTINDACLKVQDGTHFSPQNQLAQGAYRYITAKNVRPSGLDLSNVSYLAEDEHRAIYKRCDPKQGDVLLVKDGVNTGDAAVNTLDEEFSLLSSVCLLRPKPVLLYSQFLRYYLLSPVGYRMLTGQMTGTAIKRIVLGRIKESPVPIAPLDEQRTIVAEIEKQFSRLDEAVVNLKRVKANLKRYKASVLKAAVEGKLTEDWRKQHPNVEPASKLLERILAERRAKWKGKGAYKEPAAPDTTGLSELPEGWVWASLDQVTSKITSGSRDWSPYYGIGTSIFVLAQNVRPLSPDFSIQQLVDPPADDPSCERSRIKEGDLLATIVGANTGQVCLVSQMPGIAYVCQSVALMRPVLVEMSLYLNCWLNSTEHGQRYFERCMYGQGRPHLSFEQLMATPIAVPSIIEQRHIVADVERRFSFIREIERQVGINLFRAQRLRQSILVTAFSGRLIGGGHNSLKLTVIEETEHV